MKNEDTTKAGLLKLQAEQKAARQAVALLDERMKVAKQFFIKKAGIAPGLTIEKKQVQTVPCFKGIDLVLKPSKRYTVPASYRAYWQKA